MYVIHTCHTEVDRVNYQRNAKDLLEFKSIFYRYIKNNGFDNGGRLYDIPN